MDLQINSGEIISECLKHHGKGGLFVRNDGLAFEARRVEARRQFLDSHDSTTPAHREAILKAAITPGMTRDEVIAAWGLLEEDTRTSFGHVTDERLKAFAYFTGLNVGTPYALYFQDDILVGVRETDELVPPHERELDMRFAEEGGLFYFYDGTDGQLRGSNVDQYRMDWDTMHLHLYTIEVVPRSSRHRIKVYLEAQDLYEEYSAELDRLGYTNKTAPDELRVSLALRLLQYPPPPKPQPPEAPMLTPASRGDDWQVVSAITDQPKSAEIEANAMGDEESETVAEVAAPETAPENTIS